MFGKYSANEKDKKVRYNEIVKRGAEGTHSDGGHDVFPAHTLSYDASLFRLRRMNCHRAAI